MLNYQLTIDILRDHGILFVFLGSFFFGESVILAVSFLAAQGLWSLPSVFLYSFLGTVTSDSIYYFVGYKFNQRLMSDRKMMARKERMLSLVQKITGNRTFLALLFIKFLYGTRIVTIFYLALKKTSFYIFTLYNFLGTVIWLVVVMALGWSFGRGFNSYITNLDSFSYLLTGIFLIIIVYKIIILWMNRQLKKE